MTPTGYAGSLAVTASGRSAGNQRSRSGKRPEYYGKDSGDPNAATGELMARQLAEAIATMPPRRHGGRRMHGSAESGDSA